MKIHEIIGATRSAAESARVGLNAGNEAYVYLEAVRKGTEAKLLKTAAVRHQAKHGCTHAEAFATVGQRGLYIEELARGDSTFHAANESLKGQDESLGAPEPA